MGADWYFCFAFFGYKIQVPEGTTYRKFVKQMWGLAELVNVPFIITSLLPQFHSRMEGMDSDELSSLDDSANIVIGFYPSTDLDNMVELKRELFEYITDNPIFKGIDINSTPDFYSGINWFDTVDADSDDDSEYEPGESDEEESDEEESDEEESDEEESDEEKTIKESKESDEETSESESSKVHPLKE
jgi:hypothetical protein